MGIEYKEADEFIYTSTLSERKDTMMRSGAIVALPGGIGTLDEVVSTLCAKQLGIHKKPIILVNTDGYWDPLLELFKEMHKNNTIKADHLKLFTIIESPKQLMAALSQKQGGFLGVETRWWEH